MPEPTSPEQVMLKAREYARGFVTNYVPKHRNLSQRFDEIEELSHVIFKAMNEGMTLYREPIRPPSNYWEAIQSDREATIQTITAYGMHELEQMGESRKHEYKLLSEFLLSIITEINARNGANVFSNLLNTK